MPETESIKANCRECGVDLVIPSDDPNMADYLDHKCEYVCLLCAEMLSVDSPQSLIGRRPI